jgi:hypothetical protein
MVRGSYERPDRDGDYSIASPKKAAREEIQMRRIDFRRHWRRWVVRKQWTPWHFIFRGKTLCGLSSRAGAEIWNGRTGTGTICQICAKGILPGEAEGKK